MKDHWTTEGPQSGEGGDSLVWLHVALIHVQSYYKHTRFIQSQTLRFICYYSHYLHMPSKGWSDCMGRGGGGGGGGWVMCTL